MPARPLGLRIVTIAAMSSALAAALTGCAGATPRASTGLGNVGGSASPSASATPTTPTAPATPTATATQAPSYPKGAQAYAQAALDAYVKGKGSRLADLSSAGAKTNFDNIHPSNSHWHYHLCEGAAGSSYCMFDNDNGDRVRLQLENDLLGQPHAVVDVVLDATEYGASADAVVGAFMQAWHDGNTYRMKRVSNATVTSYFTHYTPQESWQLADDGTAMHTHVRITNVEGFDQTVDVQNDKIGAAHAITSVCNPTCA